MIFLLARTKICNSTLSWPTGELFPFCGMLDLLNFRSSLQTTQNDSVRGYIWFSTYTIAVLKSVNLNEETN